MTEGAAELPANQIAGVVSGFDDRGVLRERLEIGELDTRSVYVIVGRVWIVCYFIESNTSGNHLLEFVILVCHCCS